VDAAIAIAFVAVIFTSGFWIGSVRTKLQIAEAQLDIKNYRKMKKALEQASEKAKTLHNN